jgi:hypothetical protein
LIVPRIIWFESIVKSAKSTMSLQEAMGRVVNNMNVQGIPCTLNEPIPIPTGLIELPEDAKQSENTTQELKDNPLDELPAQYLREQELLFEAGWNDLLTEGFEHNFPNDNWDVLGDPTWDDDMYKPHYGYWSAWCANGGDNGLEPGDSNYPNNMDGWIISGPFDLSLATAAEVDFYWWNVSEPYFDNLTWLASTDGENFSGYAISGNYPNWYYESFDLSSVPELGNLLGDNSVWIAFTFKSDSSVNSTGAFIDDIVLRANISGPRIDSISPTSASVGTDTIITIYGQYF